MGAADRAAGVAGVSENKTPPPEGFVKQLEAEWDRARTNLTNAAVAARNAEAAWQNAVDREMDAERRYRMAREGLWP